MLATPETMTATVIHDLRLKLETLEHFVHTFLQDSAEPVSEHTLLAWLRQQQGLEWLDKGGADLSLFQSHFMLMHALYRLQWRYWSEEEADLRISALAIGKYPYQVGESGLQVADGLRSYYLDLNNLQQTTAEEVDELLSGFWTRYLAGEGREEALALLELEADATREDIEQQYRRLAAKHHPDRGGDGLQLAEINKAVAILRNCVPYR